MAMCYMTGDSVGFAIAIGLDGVVCVSLSVDEGDGCPVVIPAVEVLGSHWSADGDSMWSAVAVIVVLCEPEEMAVDVWASDVSA